MDALKQRDASRSNEARQHELQKQHGPSARAFENLLVEEMMKFVGAPSEYRTPFQMKYPMLARWYQAALQDRWELVSVDVKLNDYGLVNFKSRKLEAAFATSKIRMRNRVIGEYREQCFVTGFALDKEFDMEREPIGVDCANAATIEKHKIGLSFDSRWQVR